MRDFIPLSDGAGEVIAVGDGVRQDLGRRSRGWHFLSDDCDTRSRRLRSRSAPPSMACSPSRWRFYEDGVVPMPSGYRYKEAGLPAVCRRHRLACVLPNGHARHAGCRLVLVLGTGGVSMLALQLARSAGARVIVTSSSDEKLSARQAIWVRTLGINYRDHPGVGHGGPTRHRQVAGPTASIELGGVGTHAALHQRARPRGKVDAHRPARRDVRVASTPTR